MPHHAQQRWDVASRGRGNVMIADAPASPLHILVAGVGNALRRDDGFGVEVAQRLRYRPGLPTGVVVMDVGIGGISLVQELLDGYDVLVILDAVQRDGTPGTLYLLEPIVPDIESLDDAASTGFLADTHYAEPERALMLARALGVLPPRVFILGCQPAQTEEFAIGLTEAVASAARLAVTQVEQLLTRLSAADTLKLD